MFFRNNIQVAYVIFAAMIIASCMMLVLEFVGMRFFVKLLSIPLYILLPIIMVICVTGSFTATNTIISTWVFVWFGVIGYLLGEFEVPLAPMVLGYVLGTPNELFLFRGLQMTRGSFIPFLRSPIAASVFLVGLIYLVLKIYGFCRSKSLASD